MKKNPLSPHLQIYRIQITAVCSILHRFTGVAILLGLILMLVGFFCISVSECYWITFKALYILAGGPIWQWALIFALHYHALNGLRHLLWDYGIGYDIVDVKMSAYIILFSSVLFTFLFFYYIN